MKGGQSLGALLLCRALGFGGGGDFLRFRRRFFRFLLAFRLRFRLVFFFAERAVRLEVHLLTDLTTTAARFAGGALFRFLAGGFADITRRALAGD